MPGGDRGRWERDEGNAAARWGSAKWLKATEPLN